MTSNTANGQRHFSKRQVLLGRNYHIHPGYPVIQHSGKATIFAPPCAASEIRSSVFCTLPCKSSHAGSACVTATRRVGPDMMRVERNVSLVRTRRYRSRRWRRLRDVFRRWLLLLIRSGGLELLELGHLATKEFRVQRRSDNRANPLSEITYSSVYNQCFELRARLADTFDEKSVGGIGPRESRRGLCC